MKKENKMNNKGFSLVELIIVIAIMAILVGVLAPTYMQYVEKTRKSRDISAMDSALTVVETCLIDASVRSNSTPTVTITVGNNGGTIAFTSSESGGALGTEITALVGSYTIAGKWGATGTAPSEKITVSVATNGKVTFTNDTSVTDGVVDAMEAYSTDFGSRIE